MEEQKVELALNVAKAIKIVDDATYQQAVMFRENIKALKKEVDAAFDSQIETAFAAHKAALAAKKKYAEPLEQADKLIKTAVAQYERSLREKEEEERRLAESIGAADLLPTLPELPAATTYIRKDYGCKVVDKTALLRAILDGKVDAALVQPDMVALNRLASSAKDLFSLPGCELEVKEIVCSK